MSPASASSSLALRNTAAPTDAAIAGVVSQVVARYSRLDIAFNNARTGAGGPLHAMDEATWDRVIDANMKTAFFYLKAEAE